MRIYKMLRYIKPFYFFCALGIGLLFVYIMAPQSEIVVKFPSPYNAGNIEYKDNNDNCFVYKAENVECPRDKSKIKMQPL